jgi:signal recognition particle subunit SRP54
MLRNLVDGISGAFRNFGKKLVVDEEQLKFVLDEICNALSEADVPDFLVQEVRKNLRKKLLSPKFQNYVNKEKACKHIVWNELQKLLDPGTEPFKPKKGKTNVIIFVGLQGSGKTTTIAKYAYYYKRRKWKCALVCADTFRAGAFDQLKQNATKIGVPFFGSHTETDPVKLSAEGVRTFREEGYELIMVDTSGRHKQELDLFKEMYQIIDHINPDDIVFIMDGTIGQSAMDQAKAFKRTVDIGSVIMTKLDGNNKGGGALAAVAATKSPIIFIGNGEHFTDLEPFDPKGFSGGLLGYTDYKALLSKIPIDEFDKKSQMEMLERATKGTFTMRDLKNKLGILMKMGPMKQVISMIAPGSKLNYDDAKFRDYLVIIDSMSNKEIDHPDISKIRYKESRIQRLSRGSGKDIVVVESLFKDYKQFKKTFSMIGKKMDMNNFKRYQNNPEKLKCMMKSLMPKRKVKKKIMKVH